MDHGVLDFLLRLSISSGHDLCPEAFPIKASDNTSRIVGSPRAFGMTLGEVQLQIDSLL
jgi:hypothetical protein